MSISAKLKGTSNKSTLFNRASMDGEFLQKVQFGNRRFEEQAHGITYNFKQVS
jgi:hypothetical protein